MLADLALINGNVITMSSSQPTAQAVAIKKQHIIKVGTTSEVKQCVGNQTTVIDLLGKTVVPGFTDCHIHVGDFGKFLAWIDLKDVKSIKELKTKIKARTQQIPKGRWVIGSGWDQACFVEKRYPTVHDVDVTSPDNPIVLYHQCGRVCLVNSKALELAGITNQTVAPQRGVIEKDQKTGEVTGILHETATDLVWTKIPEPTEDEAMEACVLACQKIVEAGVTGVHWIVTSVTEVSVIKRLLKENKLPLRVYPIVSANILDQIKEGCSSLCSGGTRWGLKVFVDGSLAARTAALSEPYSDDNVTRGQLLYSQEELNRLVAKGYTSGFRLVMHAMGDQAIRLVLDAIETINDKDSHHRVEHASVLNKELIPRIRNLGMIVSVQPKCVISEYAVWSAFLRLGQKRARWLYPLKTLINEGILVIGGSDCPMEPLSPLSGIQAVVDRQYVPEERISVDDALRMYTVNAAYATDEEQTKGSIEKGKLADFTVLSGDPRKVLPSEIGEITVMMTVVGGKVVYQKPPETVL
jgi:predicted amidohydrolase YtcJ